VRQFEGVIIRTLEPTFEEILNFKGCYQTVVVGLAGLKEAAVIYAQEDQALYARQRAFCKDDW
jgi:NADH/NAD ratio-sensing transcriptional regulator Rex